jgi:DNA-binding NtrC family response regulator
MSNRESQSQSSGVSAVCVDGVARGALAALIVEDSSHDVEFIVRALQKVGYLPVCWRQVVDPDGMKTALVEGTWDVVVSEHRMPAFDSFKALAVLGASGVTVPLIMFTGSIRRGIALAAFRAGAADVVIKDGFDELGRAVSRCLRREDDDRTAPDATVRAMNEREECRQAPIDVLIDPFVLLRPRRDKAGETVTSTSGGAAVAQENR